MFWIYFQPMELYKHLRVPRQGIMSVAAFPSLPYYSNGIIRSDIWKLRFNIIWKIYLTILQVFLKKMAVRAREADNSTYKHLTTSHDWRNRVATVNLMHKTGFGCRSACMLWRAFWSHFTLPFVRIESFTVYLVACRLEFWPLNEVNDSRAICC